MLFDWGVVKEDIVKDVCNRYPDISEDYVRMIADGIDVYIKGLVIKITYEALEGKPCSRE